MIRSDRSEKASLNRAHVMGFGVILWCAIVWSSSAFAELSGGPYSLQPLDVNSGGTTSTGGPYSISASTGQPGGVGTIMAEPVPAPPLYQFDDGFWSTITLPCPPGPDCNANGTPDQCEIADCTGNPGCGDCNTNAIPDECDIADGTSLDCNQNEIPDDCECFAVDAPGAEAPVVAKNRYLSFVPGSVGCTTALRVTLTDAPPPFEGSIGSQYWVGAPWRVTELSGSAGSLPEPAFWAARLECTPHCDDWGQTGLIHVLDESVIPSATYDIQAIACGCDLGGEFNYSAAVSVGSSKWGDIVGGSNNQPPNGVADFNDISSVVDKFKNSPGAPSKARADIAPDIPDRIIDFNDILAVVDAFKGRPYPYAGPEECP